MVRLVCFHGKRRCGFCHVRGGTGPKGRTRCPCCGRFVSGRTPVECARCVARGFEARRLIEAA